MGEWLKKGFFLACVAALAWRGYTYVPGHGGSHTLSARVDGPPLCDVQIHLAAGETVVEERTSVPWRRDGIAVTGNTPVTFTVEVPLDCHFQPSQVQCAVDRDGLPWKTAEATRLTDPSNGNPAGLTCTLEAGAAD